MSELVRWLDARDFTGAIGALKGAGANAAADQLEGVSRRDERNRETTVMCALNLLRAYRYPQVAACASGDLTPERFLDGGEHDLRRRRRARPRAPTPGDPRACLSDL